MKFTVQAEPLPQPRPRFGRGKVYEPARVQKYKLAVKLAAENAMQGKLPTLQAVSCRLKFWRKFAPTSKRFGDCDNLAKAVLDACNGVLFVDDAQVVSLQVDKRQSTTTAGVEVEINELF